MEFDVNAVIQAVVAVFVIVDPIGKGAMFGILAQEATPGERRAAATKLAFAVLVILGAAALVGKPVLEAMGINLGAFGFAGGLIILLMGLEMLAGGHTSRAQGGEAKEAQAAQESLGEAVMVPLAMPLTAGPGAITVAITIASTSSDFTTTGYALIAVGVSVLALWLSCTLLGGVMTRVSDQTINIALRFAGLLLATIGVQLAFNGIKTFFGG